MANAEPKATRGLRVRATLSSGATHQAQYALLSELAQLLEAAAENVADLRDGGLDKYPLCIDARPQFEWINETVEALDALGWRKLVDDERVRDRRAARRR